MYNLKLWFIFCLVLVCETAHEIYVEERKEINYDNVKFDPIPFADIEYLTPEYYVYYIMQHLIICVILASFWSMTGDRVVKYFLILKTADLVDFVCDYNTVYFWIYSIPVTFNIISGMVWATIGTRIWIRTQSEQ